MSGLLLALGLAAAMPKLVYKPDAARAADVASVELVLPRSQCWGLTKAVVLASSRKSDRNGVYALSVTVADNPAVPIPHISGAEVVGAPLTLASIHDGDVACTEYQCPTGSAAVFSIAPAMWAAARTDGLKVRVPTNAGNWCDVNVEIGKSVVEMLSAWMEKLPPAAGR